MAIETHTIVHHNLYGTGEVTKITDSKIYVAFGTKQRIFPYPEAINRGYLSAVDVTPTRVREIILDEKREIILPGTREIILNAADYISYQTIYEAINGTVGTDYTGWMKATWPTVYPEHPFRIWFPKLAETKNGKLVSAAFDCVNTISDDWNEVVFDDLKGSETDYNVKRYTGYDLIFAKEPKGGPYIFRGLFIADMEKTRANHHVSKRIGTKVKLIGQPADRIEILDDFRK